MIIEKLTEFAKTGDKNTNELDLERGFPSRIYPARQWFNWLFNELTKKINELIDNKVDKSSELSQEEVVEGTKADSKLISAEVLKSAITTHAPKPADASTEIKGIVQLNNTLSSDAVDQALTAAQGKFIYDRMFGVDQDYQDVKLSRVLGTTYTNSTNKTRKVYISTNYSSEISKMSIYVGDRNIQDIQQDADGAVNIWVSFDVPPGKTYRVTSSLSIQLWWEM